MSLNSIATDYQNWTATSGNSIGNGGGLNLSYEDGILTFTENDGDIYMVSSNELSDTDIESLASLLGATFSSSSSSSSTSSTSTTSTTSTTTSTSAAKEELEEKTTELEGKTSLLEYYQAEYDKTISKIEDNEEEYQEIQDSIEEALKDIEEDEKQERKAIIYQAMAQYNEEEDGDWDSYLKNELKNVVPNSNLQSLVTSLSGDNESIARELGTLETKASIQNTLIETTSAEISTLEDEIAALKETLGIEDISELSELSETSSTSDLGFEELKALVSEEEWALVEGNNIDLTEKLDDGSARYIFAKGGEDGEYHIYDMGSEEYGMYLSLARLYGDSTTCSNQSYTKGFDIVPNGNGYFVPSNSAILQQVQMKGYEKCFINDPDTGAGYWDTSGSVYSLNCDGSINEECSCYSTCSPLSFDLDGDGVNISDEIIDYDIDGDGVLDKINDSMDAVLVFDKDGDGISGSDGSECFGDNTDLDGDGVKDGYNDGFEALKTLAYEAGLINGDDDMTLDENDIKFLEEEYGFKIKTDGYNSEASSLLDAGITEINLADTDDTTTIDNIDGNGNQIMYQEGATFKVNGETREYADIWHRKYEEESKLAS